MFAVTKLQISTDNQNHKSLEVRVNEYLTEHGYITASATYHDVMPDAIKRILMNRFDFTSLYIRGRADRIAVHKVKNITFEWEVKTHQRTGKNDLTIEALPMLHHIIKDKLGVRCLYIFNVNGIEGGFWVRDMPAIRCTFVPPRPAYQPIRNELISMVKTIYPTMDIVEMPVGGTGDPFFIIDKEQIVRLIDWRILVDELL